MNANNDEVAEALAAIERQARIVKLGIQPRGTVNPGTCTQAEIDALPVDYIPMYDVQMMGMVAKGQRRRSGWTRFVLLIRGKR